MFEFEKPCVAHAHFGIVGISSIRSRPHPYHYKKTTLLSKPLIGIFLDLMIWAD
jgi:hypothetical protein